MPPKKTPKPASGTSERRKTQNAIAQRIYRAKQKERLKNLERLAVVALTAQEGSGPRVNAPPTLLAPPRGHDENRLSVDLSSSSTGPSSPQALSVANTRGSTPNPLTHADIMEAMTMHSRFDQENCKSVIQNERFTLRDLIKYGLIASGFVVEQELFDLSAQMPTRDWLEALQVALGEFNVRATVVAGISLMASFNVAPMERAPHGVDTLGWELSTFPYAAAPYPSLSPVEPMRISLMSYGSALQANAIHLGITYEDFIDDFSLSPFMVFPEPGERASIASSTAEAAAAAAARARAAVQGHRRTVRHGGAPDDEIKPDLVPTQVQRTIPHHPCYDLLPWPSFRSKAIIAVSMDPPLIDEEDLCVDLLNDGVRCWGGAVGGQGGRGGGAPWDARSWEVAPWFLRKWEMLTDGKDGEMWRNSAWWRHMRGSST